MNTKILVETLIQIPDQQLLAELKDQVVKNKSLLLPDIKRFFHMISCLLSGTDRQIKIQTVELYKVALTFLLKTQAQMSWSEVAIGVIRMSGEQDEQLRKKAKDLLFEIIDTTNNANIVLERLYYDGLENQSILVMISSIKNIYSILQLYPTLLQNKTSIRIVRLILQKLISLSIGSKHIQLQKNSKQFLEKLFYLKIQKLDEVLTLMNEKVLEHLQNLWMKNKQKMLEKEKQDLQNQSKSIVSIKYEHLPLMNGKFFGVFEPYILKNIFNPEVQSAKYMAISHFRTTFQTHFEQMQKYMNVIYKVIVKFIDGLHYDLLLMLKKITFTPGINNIVNLTILPGILAPQLSTQNVPYRKQLRIVLQKLHYEVPKQCLKAYQQQVGNNQINWIQMYEIVCLSQHWIDNNMQNSYPPTLNKILQTLCHNLNSLQLKVKEKSLDVLLIILDRYPGYRQNLEDHFSAQKISQIEDSIEKRKNKGRGNSISQQAQQIFMKQYKQQRERFIKFTKNSKS